MFYHGKAFLLCLVSITTNDLARKLYSKEFCKASAILASVCVTVYKLVGCSIFEFHLISAYRVWKYFFKIVNDMLDIHVVSPLNEVIQLLIWSCTAMF